MTNIHPDFHCHRCGTCCRWPGHVLLKPWDITNLSGALGISEGNFIKRYTVLATNRAQLSLAEKPDGACCFLGDDNFCTVYSNRPQQCLDFPLGWKVDGCLHLGK